MINYPGLFVSDATPTERPVQPTGTSIGAFVGVSIKGPVNVRTFITSWPEFVRKFGSYLATSDLAYSVRNFFANGGTACWVTRVVHYESKSKTSTPAKYTVQVEIETEMTDYLELKASSDGSWGNDISVSTTVVEGLIDLTVYYKDSQVEKFTKLSLQDIEIKINGISNYLEVTVVNKEVPPAPLAKTVLSGGTDGITSMTDEDYLGDETLKTGLYTFNGVDISMISIPGQTSVILRNSLVDYAESRGDCIAVVDGPKDATPTEAKDDYKSLTASDYMYYAYPWMDCPDPIGATSTATKRVPFAPYVMGQMANIDSTRGVWKAPAGTETSLSNVIKPAYALNEAEFALLAAEFINCARTFPGQGTVIWGDRMSSGVFANHQRLKLFIKTTFKNNFSWVVFEPIDTSILGPTGKVESSGMAFMSRLYRQGAFDDEKSLNEACFVLCRRDNNPKEETDAGKLQIDVAWFNKGVAEQVHISVGIAK